MGLWRDMTGRLFDLEAKILRQASATEVQTTTVTRLRDEVAAGRAEPEALWREERLLGKMQVGRPQAARWGAGLGGGAARASCLLPPPQGRLAGLQQDFTSTANQAANMFSFLGLKPRAPAKPAPPVELPAEPPSPKAGGLFRGVAER
jgi:hypothetical protein